MLWIITNYARKALSLITVTANHGAGTTTSLNQKIRITAQ